MEKLRAIPRRRRYHVPTVGGMLCRMAMANSVRARRNSTAGACCPASCLLPQASQSERYARFIELRSGATPSTVLTVMRRAAESFADWPNERPLNFRDVVQYLAVTDCLKIDIAVAGVRSRIVDFVIDIVGQVIPRDL